MSAQTVTCEKCGEQKDPWKNCKVCYQREREEREQARANQASALLSAGFSEPFSPQGFMGMGGIDFTACLTCGAAIGLTPLVEGQTHPLDRHAAWHREAAS